MLYRLISSLYPKKIREKYFDLLVYSGIKIKKEKFIGFLVIFGFLFSLAFAFLVGLFFKSSVLISFLLSFLTFQAMVYFWILLSADSKAKFVENILPDVLQLMASNLRSGLTTDKAFLLSARPEFGPFQDEINKVGKEITLGKGIDEALFDLGKKIKSEKLNKTVILIVSGIKAGGELASLLEQTARNLRRAAIVDNRIRANVMMYVIFIFVAICFGAPLLFGLSSFLVEVLTQNLGSIQIPQTAQMNMPINISEITIKPEFVITFSIVFLITSSIMGSLILGLISKGREREGVKYIPIIILCSLLVFFVTRFLIKNMLGGLFGF